MSTELYTFFWHFLDQFLNSISKMQKKRKKWTIRICKKSQPSKMAHLKRLGLRYTCVSWRKDILIFAGGGW